MPTDRRPDRPTGGAAIQASTEILEGDRVDNPPRVNRGPTVRPLRPEPGKVYPNASIKQLRWSFHDELAEKIHAGLVIRLEVVARVNELRDHNDGARWDVHVLEISEVSE